MKVSDDVKIKENLKRYELANAVDSAVGMVISRDENGDISYNPSFIDFAKFHAVVTYLVEGVEFEDGDTFETIQSNEKLNKLVDTFLGDDDGEEIDDSVTPSFWWTGLNFNNDVNELIRFKKELYLSERNDVIREEARKAFESANTMNQLLTKLAEQNIKLVKKQIDIAEKNEEIANSMTPEEIAEMNRMLLNGKLNLDDLVESTAKRFAQESLSDERVNDIIASKNEQINALRERIDKLEKEHRKKSDDGK